MSSIEILLLVINGIILPLSGWTLYTVHSLVKDVAVGAVYGKGQEIAIADIRTRLATVEAEIIELRIEFGRQRPSRTPHLLNHTP